VDTIDTLRPLIDAVKESFPNEERAK